MSDPVGDDEQADLAVQAADPNTPLTRLQHLAQHHPELRAAIAENPATYPALLDWLGNLGMPDVEAALERRARRADAAAAPAETSPAKDPAHEAAQDPAETAVYTDPDVVSAAGEQPGGADSGGAESEGDEPGGAEPEGTVPIGDMPGGDDALEDTNPRPVERRSILGTGEQPGGAAASPAAAAAWQPGDTPAWQPAQQAPRQTAQPAPHQAPAGAHEGWQQHDRSTDAVFPAAPHDDDRRRPWWPLAILAVVATVLVIIVILQLTAGDDEPEQGAPAPADEPTAEQPTEEATTGEEDQGSDVEAAREELTALPDNTSCEDPAGDAGTFATFAAAAAPDGQWAQPSDGDLVVDTLRGLQDSCSNVHAVQVAGAITDGGGDAPEALTQTVEDAGTDWVDFARPAPDGASEVSAFASPSGNILCDLTGDPARCTIVEHDFDAPDGCDDGTTLSVGMEGQASPDCGNRVGDQGVVLEYGESGVSGFYACTSEEDGMTCWNTLTGKGFSLARAGRETF